jgi:hypothetical protein
MFGMKKKTRRSCETCLLYPGCKAWSMLGGFTNQRCDPHEYGIRCEDWIENERSSIVENPVDKIALLEG